MSNQVKAPSVSSEKIKNEALNRTKNEIESKKSPDVICEKTREEVLAEREAKKAAKQQAKKNKGKTIPSKLEETLVCADKKELGSEESVKKNIDSPKVSGGDAPSKTKDAISAVKSSKKQKKQDASIALKLHKEVVTVPLINPLTENKAPIQSVPEDKSNNEKSKAELRAERRAKQEAQRAKKSENISASIKKDKAPVIAPEKDTVVIKKREMIIKTKRIVFDDEKTHRVKLLAHLYPQTDLKSNILLGVEKVHPSITRLGAQYRSRVICGSNVRCLALLSALKKMILDYKPSQKEDISRGLEAELTRTMSFLNKCRPISVSMANAVKHLKQQVTHLQGHETQVKNEMLEWIETYIKDQVEKAAEAISITVRNKISNGDVILTYSCSSLIEKIIITAAKEGIRFRVIIVDGRPWLEGREMLRRLLLAKIHCTYILVNAVSFAMPEVTKILLGAHALLANGYVMSRCGASQIALLGRAMNVPVLVCCETHKFSERVQTDSFVFNEIGNPDELMRETSTTVTSLNLVYDVTPPDLVSAVVTELAILPCTSVPVILRIK